MRKILFKISTLIIVICFSFSVNAQEVKYSGGNGDGFAQSSSYVNKGVPGSFSAGAGVSAIQLTWQQNTDTDNVIIAYNTSNIFGTPQNGNSYSVSDVLSGGGTIVFNGSATSYLHTGLSTTTTYYYKAWSVSGTTYSTSGVTANATTQTLPAKYKGGDGDGYVSAIAGSAPLPVEISSFEGKNIDDKVELNWKTATEISNLGFEVERKNTSEVFPSLEGKKGWVKISFVKGYGSTNSPHNYSFTDHPTGGTEFSYRLKQIDNNGKYKYCDAIDVRLNVNTDPELLDNYPNPFNPTTAIKFYIPERENVSIKIYDILGREIKTLFNSISDAGYHIVYWNGRNRYGEPVASGVYIYRFITDRNVQSKKMIMLK